MPPVTEENMIKAIEATIPENLRSKINTDYDIDYSYEIKGVSRFRFNVGRVLGKHMIVVRMIPSIIPTFEDLKLPSQLRI